MGFNTHDFRSTPIPDLQEFYIEKGRAFILSDRVLDLGNNDSEYLYVENPQGSGFDYDVVLLPRASAIVDFDVSFGATRNDGTEVDAPNLKSGSSRTFSGIAEQSTDGDAGTRPTHGTTFIEDFIPGSGQGAQVAGVVIESIAYTIDEGNNKLIEVNNISGGSLKRLAINLIIFEIDGTYKERQ